MRKIKITPSGPYKAPVVILLFREMYDQKERLLTDLNWPSCSLHLRRSICDFGMFYQIHRGHVNISLPHELISVPVYSRTRASHDFKISLPSSSVNAYAAVNFNSAHPPPPTPRELGFFESKLANAPFPGQKSCSNALG